MNRRLFRVLLAAVLAALGAACQTRAAIATLPADADTGLFAAAPDNNLGRMTYVAIGTTSVGDPARGLFRFRLPDALPAGAHVESAVLHLSTVDIQRFSTHTYHLHRVLRDWGEGDKSGGGNGSGMLGELAGPGESTWRYRRSTSASWGQLGGQAGLDYVADPSASADITGLGSHVFSGNALTKDVALWWQSPGTNFGWMVILDNETSMFGSARRFATREASSNLPILTITYTVPLAFDGIFADAEGVQLEFTRQADQAYTVEFRGQVDQGAWTVLTNVTAEPQGGPAQVRDAAESVQRFYRIRTSP